MNTIGPLAPHTNRKLRLKGGDTDVVIAHRDTCSGDGEPLYEIQIDGLVTWAELEAIARALHPADLTAIDHAGMVREAGQGWTVHANGSTT